MNQLTPGLIEEGITAMSKTGLGNRSINIAVQAVRVPVAYYARMQNIMNPLQNASKQEDLSSPRGVLSSAEVGALIASQGEAPRIKAAVLLGALCGLRLGEVRGLQWEDIDFENSLLGVHHNIPSGENAVRNPKAGSERIIPMPKIVADALMLIQAMPDAEGSPFVIYNEKRKDRPATIAAIRSGFRRMLKNIGISKETQEERNLVFHGLRHTFVSLSRAAGIPDYIVQKLAGHKTAKMMEHYSDHAENVVPFLPKMAEGMARVLADVADEAKKVAEGKA
jgi:integrase